MAATHKNLSRFAVPALLAATIAALSMATSPAMAGCQSGGTTLTDGTCPANNAAGINAIAIGTNASAPLAGGIAIGGGNSTANAANAAGEETVALGSVSDAIGNRAVAVGRGSVANGVDSIASRGTATGDRSIALGLGSQAQSANSVAIGNNAIAASSVAVGNGANALGANSTAIGDGAVVQAAAANAVALGNGSVATQSNTVSVGTAGGERRITNVAPGVNGTDAVNVNQLNTVAIGGAAPLVEQLINRMDALETRVDDVARNSNRGIAGVAAMQGAVPTQPGKTTLNLGLGAYQGESAIGASIAHLTSSGRFNLNGGVSFSGGKSVARVGAGFTF
jgi:trimeric autotransporter adhesin